MLAFDERAASIALTYGLLPRSSSPCSGPPPLLGSRNVDVAADNNKKNKFYITTAINYANGSPHMGHAYEAVITDVIARYARLSGKRTKFLTGADEHGQKIANTAARLGKSPRTLVDECVAEFKALDALLDVAYDQYVRTTSGEHKARCRELWVRVAGDVTLEKYEGWYDERAEMFVKQSDAQAQNFKDADGIPLKRTTEECYFFALGKYAERIKAHVVANPEFVQPEARRSEVLKMLEEPLEKLSISRTTFDWGVSLPEGFDAGHVMYVWIDALTNYLTGSEPGGFWPADCHVIGKDIVRFHAIYWPAFLMAAGLPLPKTLFCHGFVLDAAGAKMSKTLGNVVDPIKIVNDYGSDTFRYFCCKEFPGGDLKFSETALVLARNGELAAGYGNLVHRAVALATSKCGARVPPRGSGDDDHPFDLCGLRVATQAAMEKFDVAAYASAVMAATRAANKWLYDREPWKVKDSSNRDAILRLLLEACYLLSLYLAPLIPRAATAALERVGGVHPTVPLAELSAFDNLREGADVVQGDVLFAQIPVEDAGAALNKEKKNNNNNNTNVDYVEYEDQDDTAVSRLAIVVGRIVDAWPHPDSDKLFCEKIDLGEAWGGVREIGSGLRAYYSQADLQDRLVLVVANLKPKKLAGFASKGMERNRATA
ncbi:hypothetical protein CTAYLR_009473 [Chrysophaeum taylorii]|uniref:methionine--tRNA ligase n=1 Tax=Chrysophaeum taylorii TaxID=2483200 RepID=A0AAD7XN15_9STRA|nr:hypothetical protein CTAYLR_009473 [Chrysophaeum taylorii]